MTTTNLTELQARMDALAALECRDCGGKGYLVTPCDCADDTHSGGHHKGCPSCSGTGLKREYDVLRLECRGVDLYDQGARYHDLVDSTTEGGTPICGCGGKLYTTLPAERCHEAVGKLMAACRIDVLWQLPEGRWQAKVIGRAMNEKEGYPTPEKALINARCEMEGVVIHVHEHIRRRNDTETDRDST